MRARGEGRGEGEEEREGAEGGEEGGAGWEEVCTDLPQLQLRGEVEAVRARPQGEVLVLARALLHHQLLKRLHVRKGRGGSWHEHVVSALQSQEFSRSQMRSPPSLCTKTPENTIKHTTRHAVLKAFYEAR